MLRRLLLALVLLLVVLAAGAGLVLRSAHRQIEELAPPVPDLARALAPPDAGEELPVAAGWIETARQPMPRSAVLEPSLDPEPEKPYVMSHPAFVLGWADGRRFLFDVGMTPEGARAFGAPLEWVSGAAPIEPLGSAAEQLGADAARVRGVAFSHLHADHVGGLPALCAAVGHPVAIFQRPLQAVQSNYTTSSGAEIVAGASCAVHVRVGDDGRLPGFPGLRLFSAGGHTPGSQVLVAHVRRGGEVQTWLFTGDLVNHVAGVERNLPKPRLYSLLVVPEDTAQLEALRRWLKEAEQAGARLAVNHDEQQLVASGLDRLRP